MNKVDMLKLLTTVALLTVASVLDAAPLMPGEPADGGEAATRIFEKLLKTRSMTTFPAGDGKTVAMKALDEIITATTSPNIRDKTLDTGVNNPLKTLTLLSDGHEEIRDGSLSIDRTNSSADSRLSKLIDSNEHEELVKMLSALEELHKFMNSTLSHRITFITRGNSNGRSTGKKNKMRVTDGNLKSTTATSIDGGGISPKPSTDQMDPKLNGKAFKQSLPSAKKTNKRVCFWKYCSQN
uniref:Uncharacterized LOC107718017 n=1 Tax=Sinocyclocheilus rhinocerous TaxID=307959 RepID=A0A673NGW8_9TELE